jgi:hypothetical protein
MHVCGTRCELQVVDACSCEKCKDDRFKGLTEDDILAVSAEEDALRIAELILCTLACVNAVKLVQ